ncbi:MAG: DNA gyrase subunit A [bacterium]|nr:DNA gyrase subunit A [bacterium]
MNDEQRNPAELPEESDKQINVFDNQSYEPQKTDFGLIAPKTIESEMEKSYLEYAMSVIVQRALPDVRDGLKPVHRRILYAMGTLGLRHNVKYRKSATIVGEVIGKYHPHGDTAIYDSMVRMAQEWAMRYQTVDGQGNFGSMDGDSAAAMRYTEARMTSIAEEILADLDKETVDFMPNYDGSQNEPKVLPAKVPNLIVNGTLGIAVGMATNIPPHNLGEVIEATIHCIDNPGATVADLVKFIKGPDFPTGGIIYDDGSIDSAYGTGKGSIVMRAVAEIEEDKKGDFKIIITEIPYQVNKANLVEKIAELTKDKKIVGITDIRDESDRDGVRVVIELKKDAYAKKILNQLYKLTPMQTSFHVNMLALVDGIQPRVLNLEMILKYYLKHREQVVKRRTQFELSKAKERAHILEGLKIALDQIDKVIATIRASKTQEEAAKNLIKKFNLDEVQAKAILAMQLRTLAGLERQKIEDEYAELMKLIKKLEQLLSTKANILKVIKEELTQIRDKYGDARRTKVVKSAIGEFSEEDLVPNESVIVTLTNGNYIKRINADTYRSQARGGKGIMGMTTKEEDVVGHLLQTKSHDTILFFTSKGRVFKIKVYEIPGASRTAKGQPIVNLINLQPDEIVTSMLTIQKEDKEAKFLFMATKAGVVKKTAISEYLNIRANGLIAIKLDSGDELKWVKKTNGSDDIIISTSMAQANRFKETDVRPMGRATRGVRGIKLKKDNFVVGVDIAREDGQLLVVMENGYGKRTKINQFSTHKRGGVGIKAGNVTEKTGKVIDVRSIDDIKDDLLIISRQGQVIRQHLKNISIIGRSTQGVRIMRLKAGDNVASVAQIPYSEPVQEDKKESSK